MSGGCVPPAAAIPAAPLMLPRVAPRLPGELRDDVEAMRSAAAEVLAGLEGGPAVVVLASGAREADPDPAAGGPRVYLAATASLDGLGLQATGRGVRLARGPARRLAEEAGWSIVADPPAGLPVDLASLLLQLEAAPGDPRVIPVGLPGGAQPERVAAGLAAAGLEQAPVLAAGDLSAGLTPDSPRPFIPGARDFDERVLRALTGGRTGALVAEGPEEAARVVARGWAALATVQRLVDRPVGTVVYRPLRGVGQLVASWDPA